MAGKYVRFGDEFVLAVAMKAKARTSGTARACGTSATTGSFDGYATLVRVAFRDGRVVGAHRQVDSDAYKAARAHGEVRHREFSEVPEPVSLVSRLTGLALWSPITDNANTAVAAFSPSATGVCILVDPDTLDTVRKFGHADKLGGLVHSAHPIVTTDDSSELWTVIPDLVRPGYQVVTMEAGSDERKMVGRVACRG
nr:unnamed protein product [Digitaria exilis]